MGLGGGKLLKAEYEMTNGVRVEVEYQSGAGLGYIPWPGTYALASFLDRHKDEFQLSKMNALELGSGSATLAGLAAGHLCKFTTLTDRPEVIEPLGEAASRNGLLYKKIDVKVLDWSDLDFTLSAFDPENFDLIFFADTVYYDMLWRPLLNTLLALSKMNSLILWANCDKYTKFTPQIDTFVELISEYFDVSVVEERSQDGTGCPNGVYGGKVVIRQLKLKDAEQAREAVEHVQARDCTRRCFG
mmetsp:Transcript_45082/g.96729  ORF Transcript_45082/g.96729 Transcript_45082/m.96729 type:complete len:244 (-) Transcript_45082:8-739(-)